MSVRAGPGARTGHGRPPPSCRICGRRRRRLPSAARRTAWFVVGVGAGRRRARARTVGDVRRLRRRRAGRAVGPGRSRARRAAAAVRADRRLDAGRRCARGRRRGAGLRRPTTTSTPRWPRAGGCAPRSTRRRAGRGAGGRRRREHPHRVGARRYDPRLGARAGGLDDALAGGDAAALTRLPDAVIGRVAYQVLAGLSRARRRASARSCTAARPTASGTSSASGRRDAGRSPSSGRPAPANPRWPLTSPSGSAARSSTPTRCSSTAAWTSAPRNCPSPSAAASRTTSSTCST